MFIPLHKSLTSFNLLQSFHILREAASYQMKHNNNVMKSQKSPSSKIVWDGTGLNMS